MLLDSTGDEVLQGAISKNYGSGPLVRIQILVVPTVRCNLFSVETATRKGVVSILDREIPWLEAFGVTLPLWRGYNDLYLFVLDLSADG